MIVSSGNKLAADLCDDLDTKTVRLFPSQLKRVARRKLAYLHDAGELADLKVPPGNKLESLSGNWKGFYSIRINDQWRLLFKWHASDAYEVTIIDYH